ncbi:hypothetical protein OF83DRAFT_464114 [Amylostereum chailletii]|nr:hypothetical protein OF83DRAFT_464114 [Amylostereum chailletii]
MARNKNSQTKSACTLPSGGDFVSPTRNLPGRPVPQMVPVEDPTESPRFTPPDLPVEVLQWIFRVLISLYRHDKQPYEVLSLAHVCHRWREVAFNTPELFTAIPLSNREFMDAALTYSAPLPITVAISGLISSSCIDNIRRVFHYHMSRIQWLDFWTITDIDMDVVIWDLMRSPAPLLESAHLSLTAGLLTSEIPTNIFGGHFPKLRSLFLGDGEIAFNHPLLQAPLTSLVLFNTQAWKTVDEMLDTLKALPNLEVFRTTTVAGNGVPSVLAIPRFASPTKDAVHLPRIRSFSVEDRTPQVIAILRHLRFPASAGLYLLGKGLEQDDFGLEEAEKCRITTETAARKYCDELVSFLADHYDVAPFGKQTFRSMAIALRSQKGKDCAGNILSLLPSTTRSQSVFPPTEEQVDGDYGLCEPIEPRGLFWLQLSFADLKVQFNSVALILRKVAAFTAPSVKALRISYAQPSKGASQDVLLWDNWENMFAGLKHVQKVEVVGAAAHTLVSHLYIHNEPLFCNARTIRLRETNLLDCVAFPAPIEWMPLYLMLQEGTIRTRGKLKRVEVQESTVDPQMMMDLASKLGEWRVRRVRRPEGVTWIVERPDQDHRLRVSK